MTAAFGGRQFRRREASPRARERPGRDRPHRMRIDMARESRLPLKIIIGPRDQESETKLMEGAAKRLAPGCWLCDQAVDGRHTRRRWRSSLQFGVCAGSASAPTRLANRDSIERAPVSGKIPLISGRRILSCIYVQ